MDLQLQRSSGGFGIPGIHLLNAFVSSEHMDMCQGRDGLQAL